jgi:hypothetical protein
VSDVGSWLAATHDQVDSAQRVLSEVDRGLATLEHVTSVARRTRPVLRTVAVVILGTVAVLTIVHLVRRRPSGDGDWVGDVMPEDAPPTTDV